MASKDQMKSLKTKSLFTKLLKKLHTPKWLFILLTVVLILRIPSFFEPYSYGDEMIYLTLGEAIRQGVPLYKGIHDNKPPFLYIMAAIAGNLFWFKAILSIWNIITIFLFWKLASKFFPNKNKLHKVATVIFALLTTLPLLEGNTVNAELFLIGPIIGAFLLLWPFDKTSSPKKIFTSGLLFSSAALFKIPGAFDMGTVIFAWIVVNKLRKNNLKQIILNTFYLMAGFLVPIGLTFIWYASRGALPEYFIAAFAQNVGYLSSWRANSQASFLVKNTPLILRALLVGIGLSILYIKRGKLSKQFVFISAWLFFTLFAVTLSERPYPHYLIQSVAPISLLLSIFFTAKTKEQVLVIAPLTVAFFVPFYFNFWYYPTTSYYIRFVKLATSQISKEQYLASFGDQVPINYKIASYIAATTDKDDKIFVWGDGSTLYALSKRFPPGKYVADYHIKDFSSKTAIVEELASNYPKLVILLPNGNPFPSLMAFLRENYILIQKIDGSQIWSLLSPSVRDLIAR